MNHILLVDDDQSFRRSLVIQLEFEGYRVSEVSSARQAVQYLGRCRKKGRFPDLIVSDVRMPEKTGADLVSELENDFPGIPVLILSAYEIPDRLRGYRFIRKPFKIHQIVRSIEDLTGHQ